MTAQWEDLSGRVGTHVEDVISDRLWDLGFVHAPLGDLVWERCVERLTHRVEERVWTRTREEGDR